MRKALKAGAQIILEKSRERARISPHQKTGTLAKGFRSYATPYSARI